MEETLRQDLIPATQVIKFVTAIEVVRQVSGTVDLLGVTIYTHDKGQAVLCGLPAEPDEYHLVTSILVSPNNAVARIRPGKGQNTIIYEFIGYAEAVLYPHIPTILNIL